MLGFRLSAFGYRAFGYRAFDSAFDFAVSLRLSRGGGSGVKSEGSSGIGSPKPNA